MRMRPSRTLPVVFGLAAVFLFSEATAPLSGQTPYVPYFFKNNIRYDKFDWHIYKTDHFEIYFYPDIEKHLERVASYAGKRLSARQLRTETRSGLARAADDLQNGERVSGAARLARSCPKRCSRSPNRKAIGWCCRSTSPPTSSTTRSRTN